MNDDKRLVTRAQAGDARAFEVLVNRHAPLVYNLALRLVNDPHEAEDLAQDALVRAWRALPGFRADARFSTWLYRIVMNVCFDRLPRLAGELAALDMETDDMRTLADDAQELDAAVLSAELSAHLNRAIEALPDGFRLVLSLRYLQELSYAEIAAVTGLQEGTVKSGIHRARGQLKAALLEYHAGSSSTPGGVSARTSGHQPAASLRTDPLLMGIG